MLVIRGAYILVGLIFGIFPYSLGQNYDFQLVKNTVTVDKYSPL